MLYSIGRVLQFAGLVILPVAIAGEVAQRLDLKESLSLSALGCLAFLIGWSIQQFGAKR
jgi:hypothetical protein